MSDTIRDIEDYIEMVFAYCEGHVAVRMLAEKGTPASQPKSHYFAINPQLAKRIAELVQPAAAENRGLYVVPCAVSKPGRAKTEDIYQCGTVLVDLDTGDIASKKTHLERHLGPATMVVASGGHTHDGQQKLHLYWRLTEAVFGVDLVRLAALRNLLARAVSDDESFAKLTQPIRVPGSIHGKNGVQAPVSILARNDREYDFFELNDDAERMPYMASATPNRKTSHFTNIPIGKLLTMTIRENGMNGITRFDAMSRVIGHFVWQVRTGQISAECAETEVMNYNHNNLLPPWQVERVAREFDAILRKDRAEHPEAWDGTSDTPSAPSLSEDDLAARFVTDRGVDWRYVSIWGAWYCWSGSHWTMDENQSIIDQVRKVCRETSANLKTSDARRISSMRTIRAVERLASSDRMVASLPGAWDRHNTLLNTPDGTLDLATGELIEHDRGHYLTQCTHARLSSASPHWLKFLNEITDGDTELIAYLARLAGYCLSGDTSEQVFFFFHGTGSNGKSEFLHATTHAIGDYAATAPLDSFMSRGTGSHPTDLAGLRGKRLVTVSETEAGLAWAETRIKTITGGDSIRARLLYKDFFEFTPSFKLIVAGNHRPNLVSVGEAMRRRLHLVPFNVTIPDARRDKGLRNRLEMEADGILGWMLDGYQDWQEQGLSPPSIVQEASRDYFADEDLIGQWLSEQCNVGPSLTATAQSLFENWSRWADGCGAERGSKKSFGEALRSRGFSQGRTGTSRLWKGLGFRGHARGGEA